MLPRPLLLTLALVAPLVAQAPAPRKIQGVDPSYLNPSVSACQDFYGFANGAFDKVAIPGEFPSYGVNQEIDERNYAILKAILERSARTGGPKGSLAQRVGDFYAAGMDEARIEREGLKPLMPLLLSIEAVKTPREVMAAFGRLHQLGVSVGLGFGVQVDDKDSSAMIASYWQGGLGLPERDYYFRPGPEAEAIRKAANSNRVPSVTTVEAALAAVNGLVEQRESEVEVRSLQEYHGRN